MNVKGVIARAKSCFSEEALRKPPTRSEVYDLVGTMTEALVERISILEAREYKGVHEEGREYTRGQTVSFKGSIWHANSTTRQRPGDGNDWTLAVKAGRDGKDAR